MVMVMVMVILMASVIATLSIFLFHARMEIRLAENYKEVMEAKVREISRRAEVASASRDKYRAYTEELYEQCARLRALNERTNAPVFNKEQLSRLISLCHPDKHGGRETAVSMTQVLIKLRNAAQ